MRDILFERLHNQLLIHSTMHSPAEVLAWMGAIQGQDYPGGKWSIGLRFPGSTDAQVQQAIADQAIHRTWAMRGTLHFVAAADIGWMLELLAPQIIAGNARRYRELELDEPTLVRASSLLAGALADGGELTRAELMAVLEREGISTQGQRAPYLLQRAALERLICQGVMVRNDPLYRTFDLPASSLKFPNREEAMAELIRRYFASRGPATLQDFLWWSGLPAAEARAGLEAVKADLVEEQLGGQSYWRGNGSLPREPGQADGFLLPGFDEFLLAYRDRSAALDSDTARRPKPANGMLDPTIAVGGKIKGTWKRAFSKGKVILAPNWFSPPFPAESDAFTLAARRFGEFLSLPVEIRSE